MAFVLTRREKNVLTVELNRPEKHNCIHLPMLEDLDSELRLASEDPEIRTLVIRGAGDKSFSTGGDLKAFGTLSDTDVIRWIRYGNEVFNRLEALPKPTVAVIQGYALGGGLELALACDFRIATENAVFGSPELKHGWLPGWGGMVRLRKIVGEARAKEIVLTSDSIGVERALQFGLVNRMVASSVLEKELRIFTDTLCSLDMSMVAFAKSVLGDPDGKTTGANIVLDILGVHYSKGRGPKKE